MGKYNVPQTNLWSPRYLWLFHIYWFYIYLLSCFIFIDSNPHFSTLGENKCVLLISWICAVVERVNFRVGTFYWSPVHGLPRMDYPKLPTLRKKKITKAWLFWSMERFLRDLVFFFFFFQCCSTGTFIRPVWWQIPCVSDTLRGEFSLA